MTEEVFGFITYKYLKGFQYFPPLVFLAQL